MENAVTTCGAIFTDEIVVEAMHTMRDALNAWERVGAAEEIDLDEMDEVDERFASALKQLNAVISRRARGLVTIVEPAEFTSGEVITDPVIQQAAGRARSHH